MDEQRIIEVETRLAYLEHTVTELNDVVTGQQQQLARVERLVDVLTERFKAMADALPDGGTPQDQRPPHY